MSTRKRLPENIPSFEAGTHFRYPFAKTAPISWNRPCRSRMRRAAVVAGLIWTAWCGIAPAEVLLYVSPDGNDAWSGRLRTPNAARTDGPLASLDGARRAVRRLLSTSPRPGPIRVLFQSGVYQLQHPVVFTPDDSGAKDAPVSYEAAPGARPVFSGGRRLRGFRVENSVWTLKIPEAADGKWHFRTLFVNGERTTRARTPNAPGWFYIRAPAPPLRDPATGKETPREKTAFLFRKGDIKPWPDLQDVLVVSYDAWDLSIIPIASVDTDKRIVSFPRPVFWRFKQWDGRYYVENAPDALDAPGEWRLDRRTGVLSYIPLPGQTPDNVEVVAPVIETFVELRGDPESGLFVEHIRFSGLTFEYGDWHLPEGGYRGMQAAFQIPAVIDAEGARRIRIEDCEIRNVGLYAVAFGRGCRNNLVQRCHFHDLGAGGVKLGAPSPGAKPYDAASHNTVDNCFIHRGGQVYPSAVGVWVGASSWNRVAHNEICDMYYTGISVGWNWGFGPSTAHHNRIEYNHIYRIGRRRLSDMGGIYTLGVSPGTVLRGNVIHDLDMFLYGSTGIYLDQGSSEILVENNLCYRCETGGFTIGDGREVVVRNNIFAFGRTHQISLGRPKEHKHLTFTRNIILWDEGRLAGYRWDEGNIESDYNLYWNRSGAPIKVGRYTFDEWREKGRDVHSIIADPRFVAPDHGDFRLHPDSPAFKLGFKPFDTKRAGLYGDPAWTRLPESARPYPLDPKPEPHPVEDDFEDLPPGSPPLFARVYGNEKGGRVAVTDAVAASGRQCLEVRDSPELEQDFNPHFYYETRYAGGRVRFAFDLRLGPGAHPTIEWRDWSEPRFRIGPQLIVKPDGRLFAGEQEIVSLPVNRWVHVEMTCALGDKADGFWNLTITLPDGTKHVRRNLPCGVRKFSKVTWIGFISNGREPTVFYVDNISLAPVSGSKRARAPDD